MGGSRCRSDGGSWGRDCTFERYKTTRTGCRGRDYPRKTVFWHNRIANRRPPRMLSIIRWTPLGRLDGYLPYCALEKLIFQQCMGASPAAILQHGSGESPRLLPTTVISCALYTPVRIKYPPALDTFSQCKRQLLDVTWRERGSRNSTSPGGPTSTFPARRHKNPAQNGNQKRCVRVRASCCPGRELPHCRCYSFDPVRARMHAHPIIPREWYGAQENRVLVYNQPPSYLTA